MVGPPITGGVGSAKFGGVTVEGPPMIGEGGGDGGATVDGPPIMGGVGTAADGGVTVDGPPIMGGVGTSAEGGVTVDGPPIMGGVGTAAEGGVTVDGPPIMGGVGTLADGGVTEDGPPIMGGVGTSAEGGVTVDGPPIMGGVGTAGDGGATVDGPPITGALGACLDIIPFLDFFADFGLFTLDMLFFEEGCFFLSGEGACARNSRSTPRSLSGIKSWCCAEISPSRASIQTATATPPVNLTDTILFRKEERCSSFSAV